MECEAPFEGGTLQNGRDAYCEGSDLLQTQDWMTHLDLKDAYFAISVNHENLVLSVGNTEFPAQVSTIQPVNCTSCVTKVLHPIVGQLQSMGVQCVIYLEDILIMHQIKDNLLQQM